MARVLNQRDLEILHKLVPELEDDTCAHSGTQYRSVLPPLSMHYARDPEDFKRRIELLEDEEVEYLVELIFNGAESLHCTMPEHLKAFLELVERRISKQKADELRELYTFLE